MMTMRLTCPDPKSRNDVIEDRLCGDPVGAAMELMFQRDGAQIERKHPDGSIGYR